ncbi:MAG TPA: glycoside hydrolase family 71/99-like protein [Chryseosolibacter sp.]|nr:glycoside hydrolase family 71/99-like protein [Chryseosolibacter sp.]
MRTVCARFLAYLVAALPVASCSDDADGPVVKIHDPVPVEKTADAAIYAHMMPWFETPASNNGAWGIHWTMANRNPEVVDASTGTRQIASHFYPLIGPYASGDPDVIEYQLLLMKYAGIDGVLIDWYGTIDLYDYAANEKNTRKIVTLASKVGLKYALVYEDRTIATALDAGKISNGVTAAKADMQFISANYMNSSSYLEVDGKPVLLVFGPQYFHSEPEWNDIFSVFPVKPHFWTLWYESGEAGANATGEYAWVYQDQNSHDTHLSNFYNRSITRTKVGSAYPGFRDFYKQGGWGENYFLIEHNGTATFEQTLDLALENATHIQLNTWNDYGEGTMIEPTAEFGYAYLTTLQSALGVPYSLTELELIARLYSLRKKYSDIETNHQLDQAFNYLVSLKITDASAILSSIE